MCVSMWQGVSPPPRVTSGHSNAVCVCVSHVCVLVCVMLPWRVQGRCAGACFLRSGMRARRRHSTRLLLRHQGPNQQLRGAKTAALSRLADGARGGGDRIKGSKKVAVNDFRSHCDVYNRKRGQMCKHLILILLWLDFRVLISFHLLSQRTADAKPGV